MTVAPRDNIAPSPGVSLTPLAARLELLLRRAISVDQFEADMVSCCEAHPDEVWNLLALLDQYHRLERLPTELYRALKAATDRYGLVRREPYSPYVSVKTRPEPAPGAEAAAAPTRDVLPATAQNTPMTTPSTGTPASSSAPESPQVPPVATAAPSPSVVPPEAPKAPSAAATGSTPFRHLLDDDDNDDELVTGHPSIGRPVKAIRPGTRPVPPSRPERSSKARQWLLPTLLVAVALGAAAWLKQGQGSVDMLAGPEDVAQQAANTATMNTPPKTPAAAPAQAAAPEAATTPAGAAATASPTVPATQPAALASPQVVLASPPPPATPTAAPKSPAQPAADSAPRTAPSAAPAAAAPVAAAPVAAAAVAAAPVAAARASAAPAVAAAGPPTIEFSADSYAVNAGDSAARIVVRRSGNTSGDLDFVWWTENATAVADVDYVAWGHRTEKFPSGHSSVTLLVPIINDSTRAAPRRFQVVIGSVDNGARLGATTHATVQLSGN